MSLQLQQLRTEHNSWDVHSVQGLPPWVTMAESFRRELETEEGVEDMINLSDLNEHIILHNLRTRYGRDHIYTYVGSILVAVNPYRTFNIYGLDMVKLYDSQQLGNLPPHLFAISSASYSKMVKEKENQVLVISGESGAGKTESTKLIMQYLAAVNKSNNNLITEQILEANPLLESFGNAKTIRNDNSSRFGKYIEVFFKNGGIVGAKTSEYLLEKSRIVTQAPEERNYHIFYEMLEALTDDQKSQLGLQTAPKYFYLNQEDNHETAILGSEAEIKWVSHLLMLSDEWLKQALTSKVTEARGERVVSPYNLDQALDARDAIAKALYSRLFTWLVERVNLIVCRAEREKTTSLAVLDIFGFEVLHFLEKNKDTLRSDVVELMCESKNKLIAQMFADLRDRQITKTLSKTTGRYVTMKPRTPTVAASFNESLLSLIDSMSRCHPFFVRCIKPNVYKQAMQFEDPVVMDQLRYTGMLETIRIRKMGYPVRLKFPVFIQRYRCLLKGTTIRHSQLPSEACAMILSTLGPSHKDEYQIGATKVFMKETFEAVINKEAEKIQRVAAVCIQTHTRAYLVRRKFLKARAASNSIQRMIRMWRARRHFLATRNGIIKAQAQFRMFRQRRQYLQRREEIRRKLEEQKIARRRQEAHQKLEREQRERAARNMASVANLEVPGELAYVYSKLDEWRLPHDGVNIMAAAGDVQAMDMGYRLPVDINSHSFSKFTSVYFREPRWGVKMEPLKSSLTNLQSDDLVYKSLSLFKLILRYMSEENMTEKREKILSDYIVQMGLQNEGLRDELLCQVANQAWQNQNAEQIERIWRLMASCLSCLMPSSSLFKYLLKFVSDVAVNGYKIVCQHKVLQSANLAPQLSRVYPPCFLEWRAIQRKASMALEAKFPDDISVIGHVESWTSGELFTSHLLKQRGLTENTQGWTVILQEDFERYELMGYDYVLDLISEIEIAPGFPTCKAYFLVSTDKNQDRLHRKHHHEGPHGDLERFLLLVPPMPEMLKRTLPPVPLGASGGHKTPTAEELGFSTTSILNQRPTEIFISELSDSRMNARYTKRRAPAPPTNGHISNGYAHGAMNGSALNGDMSTIDENDEDMGLSHTQINARYFPDVASNGVNGELSTSKLNQRYTKNFSGQGVRNKTGVKDQIRKKYSGVSGVSAADVHSVTSEHSDWSHWVEDVFDTVLNEHIDDAASDGKSLHTRIKGGGKGVTQKSYKQKSAVQYPGNESSLELNQIGNIHSGTSSLRARNANLVSSKLSDWHQWVDDTFESVLRNEHMADTASNGQSLHTRIKGGGKGVPGLQTQQTIIPPPLNMGLGLTTPASVVAPPMISPAFTFNSQLTPGLQPQQDALQQLLNQQAMQQQQAALQAVLLSIERENLKKQLQQMQGQTSPPSAGFQTTTFASAQAAALSPDNSFSSTIMMPPGAQITPGERFHVPYGSSEMVTATSSSKEGPPVAPKRVHLIKSSFENQPSASYGFQQSGKTVGVAKTTKTVTFNTTTTVQQSHPESTAATSLFGKRSSSPPPSISPPSPPSPPPLAAHPPIPPSPPSPPPPPQVMDSSVHISESIYVDARTAAPPLHSQPVAPPPSPPPLPPMSTIPLGLEIDKEKGTFTVRDKSGRARTVRIGKVVWPPPSEEIHKQEVQVGKLEIDEKVARGIENRIIGKRKWQKPVVPDDEPKSILKRSNVESTRRAKSLIETGHSETLKLLERKLGGSAKTQMDDASVSTKLPGQSVGLQTTNTLKKMQHSASVQANEAIYASFIEKDEPPPPPKAPPPQLKIRKKETVEVEEKFETVIQSDQHESFEPRIEPDVEQKPLIDYASFERAITELYPQNKKYFLMYSKVPWSLLIRKEVGVLASERLDNSTILHLVYCQVVQDVFNNACVRISKEQRIKMRSMLDGHGVEKSNYLTKELSLQVKKVIVDTAKEWPTYFCRLFPIACIGHYADVKYLGISHTGLRFVTRERSVVEDHLTVLEEFRFEDVVDTVMPTSTSVQLNLRTKSLIFQTIRPKQLKDMVDRFCQESEKGNKFVVAVKDYITRESTLLSFKNGDIIKLMDPEMNLERGWLYGSLNGIVGLFPEEYVRPLARHEVENSSMKPKLYQLPSQPGRPLSREGPPPDNYSETSQGTVVHDGKYSMMEFAILHFRESLDKYEMLRTEDGSIRGTVKKIENYKLHVLQKDDYSKREGNQEWSWKEQADMIKWTRSPIQASLLKLSSSELNKLALECFISIMRFMGDYPMGSNQTDFDCVMKILRTCHKYPDLRDEVYCQLCKQTTNNRSMKGKSKIRGWRLFGLVAAYCDCSEMLRPYLFKYLETTASDVNRTYNYAAALCLQNLRKTFKYGGRKNVPLREEVQALADGRNSKRLPFYYSGTDTQGGLLQVKPCTVVSDAIMDVCSELNIIDPVEMEEYTLFEGLFTKLNREEYLLDITAEFIRKKTSYDLIFQRTVWIFPLSHMDNEVYVDVMFHQCKFDYIDGLNIVWPRGELEPATVDDMGTIGALLHRANDFVGLPTLKQLEVLVPKTVQNGPLMRPQQWLNRIQDKLRDITGHSSLQAKALFLEILSRWPLFGATFFLIKSIPNTTGECKLVVNKRGIAFLHKDTHETFLAHPFSEILSTRRYRSDSGHNYLDMKIGDLMVQKVLRIETDQGSDISSLIAQYMQVLNRGNKRYSQRL
ncbi:hypothetical protein C0Q70_01819 [Pomacea canaliculata]|uniref:Myosin motor domain-containing protein n=1 Tax=Pomacea canaliculata TaxID=400727 RepID=A0A2T7Q0J2_POMCA|nr:hypothetical protein C0Q70_01819 [Pomacea canaliculata]